MKQLETARRNSYIKQLAKESKTAEEIAEIVGMKRERVMTILRSYKIKAVRAEHKLHSQLAQTVIKELDAGTKQIEIAKKLNISRQYVNQVKKTCDNIKETR